MFLFLHGSRIMRQQLLRTPGEIDPVDKMGRFHRPKRFYSLAIGFNKKMKVVKH